MDIKEFLQIVFIKRKTNASEVARLTNQSTPNFSQKLKRNDLRISDLEAIATALDCHLLLQFIDNQTNNPL